MEKARRHFLRTISGVAALGAASSTDVRAQFPLLGDSMNGRPLVYLDSAATTQRPRAVLDTLDTFYLHENANPSMSLHALARHSASLYDEARATVARFLNARGSGEIVFTRGIVLGWREPRSRRRNSDHGIRPLFEFSSVAAGGAAHGSDAPYLGCQRRRTSAARPVGHTPFEANEDGDVSARFECPWRDQSGEGNL